MMEDCQDYQEEESTMRQSELVKETMGKVVATKSAINYAYQNGSFALFCYGNEVLREKLLEPWFTRGLAQCTTFKAKTKFLQDCFLACSTEDDNCLLFCRISRFPILVTSYQPEQGQEEKIKASKILWGLPRTIRQRAPSFTFLG